MQKKHYFLFVMLTVAALTACRSHPDLQYTPAQYAKLRGIELLTSTPTRSYEVVANVRGTGGQYTAKETMINQMIDAAQKVGARALIPAEDDGSENHAQAKSGLDAFVYIENNRRITKARAIQWTSN